MVWLTEIGSKDTWDGNIGVRRLHSMSGPFYMPNLIVTGDTEVNKVGNIH